MGLPRRGCRSGSAPNGHDSHEAASVMMVVLAENASKTFRKLDGFNHIDNVFNIIMFVDGELKMAA